jgi:hypothetical protein
MQLHATAFNCIQLYSTAHATAFNYIQLYATAHATAFNCACNCACNCVQLHSTALNCIQLHSTALNLHSPAAGCAGGCSSRPGGTTAARLWATGARRSSGSPAPCARSPALRRSCRGSGRDPGCSAPVGSPRRSGAGACACVYLR